MTTKIASSTGDVFRDLGFGVAESKDLRLRSDLIIELQEQIAQLGQSQSQIAAKLGVSQPRVSNLVKGRLDLFSLDSLVEMLDRFGKRVDVTVRTKNSEEPSIVIANIMTVASSWTLPTESPVAVLATEAFTLSPELFFGTVGTPEKNNNFAADSQYALAA